MVKLTRRDLIIGGGATAALAGTGAIRALSGNAETFLAEFIRHALPTELIAPGAAEAFAADYLRDDAYEDPAKVEMLTWTARLIGLGGLDMVMGSLGSYEHFKRRVATAFMLGSTFFQRQSPDEPVQYVGIDLPCARNPFARFA